MNELGQYYTESSFSDLLISFISNNNPKKVLELGVGKGSLLKAALQRWNNIDFIGADVDDDNISMLSNEFPNINFYLLNGLSSKLDSKLNLEINSIDVAICNPPYLYIDKNKEVNSIVYNAGLGKSTNYKRLTSDIVFMAQNLILLKSGGELGIILPDGLITSHEFEFFRKQILNNHLLLGIIELPDRIFKKTEAKTFILLIKKGNISKKSYRVPLIKADKDGLILDKIFITSDNLIRRMDYTYHKWQKSTPSLSGKSLGELNVKIQRGKYTKKELTMMNVDFIHTSDLYSNTSSELIFRKNKYENGVIAQKGDIVLSRVGKRCIGTFSIIKKGNVLISDCIYRIQTTEVIRKKIIDALNSDYGKKWMKAHSHGVCAKVISKTDLLNFRV
ncbi:MAG: N-6 DNA methylase [Vicingus serpentipes]|nr:N-6 DNA methylase [Vicingus serpentipes]